LIEEKKAKKIKDNMRKREEQINETHKSFSSFNE